MIEELSISDRHLSITGEGSDLNLIPVKPNIKGMLAELTVEQNGVVNRIYLDEEALGEISDWIYACEEYGDE